MVMGRLASVDLDICLRNLVVGGKMERGAIADWKDIPVELLLRIVSLVDDRTVITAAGVCTGWRDAICAGLTHLSLSWCKEHMNDLVLSLAPNFTKLQVLTLRQNKPQLEDEAVIAVANNCRDLRDLDLSKSFKLTDRSLYALAHGCPSLSKLNISGCSAFSDVALSYLTNVCKNLKNLNLCGCVKAVSDNALKAISGNCSQLQYLNVGWCDGVTDLGVMSLALGCPELRAIDLCGCVLITDESVIALASRCHHLRSLGLYFCQNITDRAMYSLAANSRVSKHELWKSVLGSYSNCSSSSSSSSVISSSDDEEGLSNLNISQCTALTPPAVQAVCDSFPALHTCPGRHSLIISGCLSLTSVHCACALQAHREGRRLFSLAHL